MALWSPDYKDDGDFLNAASFNTPLGDAETVINGLVRNNLRRGAFNFDMCHDPFVGGPFVAQWDDSGTIKYDYSTFGSSMTYFAYGSDGGSRVTGTYTGDRCLVGHPDHTGTGSTNLPAHLDLAGPTSSAGLYLGWGNGDNCSGLLLLANVNVGRIVDSAANHAVMFCLQYKTDADSTWRTIDRTERFVTRDDHMSDSTSSTEQMLIDVPIVTFLTEDDLTADGLNPATDKVTDIELMCSLSLAGAGSEIILDRWNLTGIPLMAKKQT